MRRDALSLKPPTARLCTILPSSVIVVDRLQPLVNVPRTLCMWLRCTRPTLKSGSLTVCCRSFWSFWKFWKMLRVGAQRERVTHEFWWVNWSCCGSWQGYGGVGGVKGLAAQQSKKRLNARTRSAFLSIIHLCIISLPYDSRSIKEHLLSHKTLFFFGF